MTIDGLAKSLISPFASRNPMIVKIKANFDVIEDGVDIDEVIDALFQFRDEVREEYLWDLTTKERRMATEIGLKLRRKPMDV